MGSKVGWVGEEKGNHPWLQESKKGTIDGSREKRERWDLGRMVGERQPQKKKLFKKCYDETQLFLNYILKVKIKYKMNKNKFVCGNVQNS